MKSPVEKSSDQESGSIGNALSTKKRPSVSASTIEESLLPIKKRQSGSNEALRILEMQETKEKKAVETAGTKKLQPRRSLRISEMQEEEAAGMEVRNLQPRRSLRIGSAQVSEIERKGMHDKNKGKGKEKEPVGMEVRNPTEKLQKTSNASLRIGNAQGSEIERKGMQEIHRGKGKEKEVRNPTEKLQNASLRIGNAQERNKGKGKEEVVETAGMEVRKPTKKEVEDDARRVTAIIKKWTALRWQYAYSSKSLPVSKKFYKLEFKRDQDLRDLLRPGEQAAVDKDGLSVPTVDDKGRRFRVVLKQSSGYLMLTGEGWSKLVQLNMVETRSVFQIYTHRERCLLKFGIFFKIPN